MASYDEARVNEFTAAATKTIMGVPLEPAEQSPLISGIDRIPIKICPLCFTEPCPCDGPIVWIPEEALRERVSTTRQTTAGEELYEFKIDLDATVLVESVVRMKAGDLGRSGRSHFRELNPSSHLPTKGGCGCGGGSHSETTRSAGGRTSGYYDGQECAGHTLYDVYVEAVGLDTTFYYTAVGSC
jgi:hypothetical protein